MASRALGKSLLIGIRSAALEMASNRFRSCLSLMGIALSVGALTSILAIQEGAGRNMEKTILKMGGPGRIAMKSNLPRDLKEELLFSRSRGLNLADADTLNLAGGDVATAYKSIWADLGISFLGEQHSARIVGVDQRTLEVGARIILEDGRLFRPFEYAKGERVALVGWKISEALFPILGKRRPKETSLAGQFLDVSGHRYRIAGTFAKEDRKWEGPGRSIYIPIASMVRDFSGTAPRVDWMELDIGSPDQAAARAGELAKVMSRSHRGAGDVSFRFFEWMDDYRRTMDNLRLVFAIIAAIALSVGGVNILNLMLSTISERIREIGLRKALGATSKHIFLQFLAEAVTLSLSGGVLGAFIGMIPLAFADAIELGTHGIRPQLHLLSFLWVFLLSAAIGVLAGVFPAWKASKLNPIDALQYD